MMDVFQRPWLCGGPKSEPKPLSMSTSPISHHSSPYSTADSSTVCTTGSFQSSSDTSIARHEYEYRDRLRTWLVKMIDSGDVPGLKWLNDEKTIFRMPWKHAGRQDYNLEDSKIFMEWAKHSGRYREGIDKPEPIVWKTRLRCALNKMPDIRELPELSRLDISDPYRVYELLPPIHKGSGNDDKIRRRVYKRSATGSNDELDNGPISPKISRSDSGQSHVGNQSGMGSPPASHGRPFYPVFNHHSPLGHGGSTGTQSQESDSNSNEGSNDRISPPVQSHVGNPMSAMKPFQPQIPPIAAQRPISYPIPLPGTQSGLANLSPSSFALALVNCNPLVSSDPMLSSSLTTLATQVLHLEHMMQAHLSQARSAQSEVSQLREDIREVTNKLHLARSEKAQMEQTLLLKICNSQDNADSKLLEMLPTDQKLHLFHERLQTSRDELQNERHRRQQLEQETMQLKSSLEHLTNSLQQISGNVHKQSLQPPVIQGLESPPSSRHSESENSESDTRRDSVDNGEEIEVIES